MSRLTANITIRLQYVSLVLDHKVCDIDTSNIYNTVKMCIICIHVYQKKYNIGLEAETLNHYNNCIEFPQLKNIKRVFTFVNVNGFLK